MRLLGRQLQHAVGQLGQKMPVVGEECRTDNGLVRRDTSEAIVSSKRWEFLGRRCKRWNIRKHRNTVPSATANLGGVMARKNLTDRLLRTPRATVQLTVATMWSTNISR